MKAELKEILTEMADEDMPRLVDRMLEELGEGLADRLQDLPGIAKANPLQVGRIFHRALMTALREEQDQVVGTCQFIMEEFCEGEDA